MKKNIIMRAALLLMTLTVAVTAISFMFTSAQFVSRDIESNEFGVYHLISFQRTGYGWGTGGVDGTGSSHTTFNNAPAGEWAFFVRGTHGTHHAVADSGRPGVFMGIFNKSTEGHFSAGVVRGGDRNVGTSGGHGGHMAYIMSNRALPGNANDTLGWVAIAGGGGGRGAASAGNHLNLRGGDAGGQTGNINTWTYQNGANGFFGGFRGGGTSNTNPQQVETTATFERNGGGGGIAAGGQAGVGWGTTPSGNPGSWLLGGYASGNAPFWVATHSGGGGSGVFGGGGGGGGATVYSGAGGGGSSFSGATAAVPATAATPQTYREHAIALFWELVGGAHTDTGRTHDGTIILVWLGP